MLSVLRQQSCYIVRSHILWCNTPLPVYSVSYGAVWRCHYNSSSMTQQYLIEGHLLVCHLRLQDVPLLLCLSPIPRHPGTRSNSCTTAIPAWHVLPLCRARENARVDVPKAPAWWHKGTTTVDAWQAPMHRLGRRGDIMLTLIQKAGQ